MSTLSWNKGEPPSFRLVLLALALVACSSCGKHETKVAASNVAQKTFASPDAAGEALLEAARTGDQVALMAVFGPDGKDFVFSGDPASDQNAMRHFVGAYTQMHRWSQRKSGDEILYVGADNFAFPISLTRISPGEWAFDTAAGKDEVLARRIGDGELTAIGMLTEIVTAQQRYFSQTHQFAQKFVSDQNQRNGLYWPVNTDQLRSPLDRLAEEIKVIGSRSGKPQPLNGYYYKMLMEQGDAAKGGAKEFVVDGKLIGGFAVLAWPAKYRDSGIMTFLVGKDGTIYQKDLGENTSEAATAITAYNPEKGWTVVLVPEPPKPSDNSQDLAPDLGN